MHMWDFLSWYFKLFKTTEMVFDFKIREGQDYKQLRNRCLHCDNKHMSLLFFFIFIFFTYLHK